MNRTPDLTLVRDDAHPRHLPGQHALPLVDGANALAPVTAPPQPARPRLTLVGDDLRRRAGRFVQAVLEVQSGTRPLGQIARVLSTEVHDDLRHRVSLLARTRSRVSSPPPRARVASVRVYQPRADAAEITARFVRNGRSSAVAARIEYDTERREPTWVCTALCWV